MSKIFLVAKREFLTRVQKRTFLLTTIGLPILIFGLYALIIFFSVSGSKDYKIAVADEAKIFKQSLQGKNKDVIFSFVNNQSAATLTKALEEEKYAAFIYVP